MVKILKYWLIAIFYRKKNNNKLNEKNENDKPARVNTTAGRLLDKPYDSGIICSYSRLIGSEKNSLG